MTDKQCFILGSGRSLLNLTDDEKRFLNKHKKTLGMNRYLIFHEKIGVIPEACFLADYHDLAKWALMETIRKASMIRSKPRLYLNRDYREILSQSPGAEQLWVQLRKNFMDAYGYLAPSEINYRPVTFFERIEDSSLPFSWAENFQQKLYFYRGSLTTAINLTNIVWPGHDIYLLGVDLNTRDSFFQEEVDSRPELDCMLTKGGKVRQEVAKARNTHSTALNLGDEPGGSGIQAVIPKIRNELARRSVRLLCCNPESLLVSDGVCEYSPIMGR